MSDRIPEIETSVDLLRSIIWQYDTAESVKSLISHKNDWYKIEQTEFWNNWFRDVFDIRTANDFGLEIWSIILGVSFLVSDCPGKVLTTEQKRLICRLRYYQLITRCTIPEVNEITMRLFATEDGKAYALDPLDMSCILYVFTEQPTSAVALILAKYDLLPRPATVGLKYRVIRYVPFGFGQHYQNFENAPFWDGGGLINYAWRINLSFDTDNGILHGQVGSSDSSIDLSGVDVTLFYTKSTGETFTQEVTTGAGGLFTAPVTQSGTYTVVAKAQVFTPICTTDDVESRAYSFTYIIPGADVMLKVYDPAAALFHLRDASEAGKFTIDYGDGVDSKDYRVDVNGLVFATRSLTEGKTYHVTIKRSDSCRFYFNASSKMVNKVIEVISVSGSRVNMVSCFTAQDELIKIHDKAFDYLPNTTTFEYCFYGCLRLPVIPDNLFKYCPFVVNFGYVFLACSSLLYIPAGMFDYNPLVSTFRYAFRLCVLLKEIPSGLFDKNTLVTSFYVTFADCYGLLTFPRGLFDKATMATDFGNLIQNCNNITTDIKDIFPLELYSAITYLTRAFNGCSKMKGSGVDFISKVPNVTAYQSHDNVFTGAIGLSDYYQIPAAWR